MLVKMLVGLAKLGVGLFAFLECVVALMFLILASDFGIGFLARNGNWPWGPEHPMNGVLFVLVIILPGGLLMWRNIGKSEDVCFDLDGWGTLRLRDMPLLHICHNNGVTAVVTEKHYASSFGRVVEGAMTFSDSKNPEVRKRVTGTMADFYRLTYNAQIVVHLRPRHLYVPYTSGMMPREQEDAQFPRISLEEAERRIWDGFKRPKQKA